MWPTCLMAPRSLSAGVGGEEEGADGSRHTAANMQMTRKERIVAEEQLTVTALLISSSQLAAVIDHITARTFQRSALHLADSIFFMAPCVMVSLSCQRHRSPREINLYNPPLSHPPRPTPTITV